MVIIIASALFLLFYLFMGMYAFLQDPRAGANRIFPCITLVFANWALAALVRTAVVSPEVVVYWRLSSNVSWSIGSAGILHFALLLSRKGKGRGMVGRDGRGRRSRGRGLHGLVYLPALLLFLLTLPGALEPVSTLPVLLPPFIALPVSTLWYLLTMPGSAVLLFRWGRRSQKQSEKIQGNIISISLLISTVGIFLYGMVLPLIVEETLPFALPLFPMIWISGMGIAITRYRFLSFRREIAVKEIMESILDLVFLADGDGFIIDLNRQARQILGYEMAELTERSIFSLLKVETALRGMIHSVRRGEMEAYRAEAELLRRDGSVLPVRIRFSSVRDEHQQVMGLVLAAQDLRMERQFMALSVTDRLTGLANRLKLDEVLDYELLRSRRGKNSFSLIIMDIDHFKEINDSYGHQQGDLVLVELAGMLRDSTRSSDTVGRWGGEEFMIILPDADGDEAAKTAGKLQCAIGAHPFKGIPPLTCSFGVASFRDGDSFDSIVARADGALYSAKKGGRNCVCTENEETVSPGTEKN